MSGGALFWSEVLHMLAVCGERDVRLEMRVGGRVGRLVWEDGGAVEAELRGAAVVYYYMVWPEGAQGVGRFRRWGEAALPVALQHGVRRYEVPMWGHVSAEMKGVLSHVGLADVRGDVGGGDVRVGSVYWEWVAGEAGGDVALARRSPR